MHSTQFTCVFYTLDLIDQLCLLHFSLCTRHPFCETVTHRRVHRQVHAAAAGVERPAGATPPRSPPCMAEQRRGRRCAGAAHLGAEAPPSSAGARRPREEASYCVRGPRGLRRRGRPRRRWRRTGPGAQALADTMIEIEHDLFTLLVWPLISCSRPTEPMDGFFNLFFLHRSRS